MRKICIFPNSYDLFAKQQYEIYQYLCFIFGKDNVYITVSRQKWPLKQFFTFNELQNMLNKLYNIDKQHILFVWDIYQPSELKYKFDMDNTILIYALQRNNLLYNDINVIEDNKAEFKPFKQEIYGIIIPVVNNKLYGIPYDLNDVKRIFKSNRIKTKEKKVIFKGIFKEYNEQIFQMFLNKVGISYSTT